MAAGPKPSPSRTAELEARPISELTERQILAILQSNDRIGVQVLRREFFDGTGWGPTRSQPVPLQIDEFDAEEEEEGGVNRKPRSSHARPLLASGRPRGAPAQAQVLGPKYGAQGPLLDVDVKAC